MATPKPKRSMSRIHKILFFATGWLIVLMPFLFWWNTWFGRHLSDQQMTEYLHDDKKPRHIQHALVQLEERMSHQDATATRWYPDLLRLARHPVEEVRNTDAWVRGNAALSLVRFRDATGRPQIVALLQPAHITAPAAGTIVDADRPGTAIHQGGLIAKLSVSRSSSPLEIRSPIPGRIRSVMQTGANVVAGSEVAVIDPATEQVWEALRALYVIGQAEDVPAVRPYERELPDISDDVRRQAEETEKAIQQRYSR